MAEIVLNDRYELLQKIGEGGTALVYKAKDRRLDRFVAIKVLKEELSKDIEFVGKFKREATAVATFSNNNIVNIYDVGSDKEVNYIVLEYVNGKTLKDIIRGEGRLDWKKAIDMGRQIALALDCAHKNNIIHRDIKPQNILVTEDGVAKVTDFGIARASNSVTITSTEKVMGSAHYLSPEQAKGAKLDCKTDIYSLGIVLYEMVTGKVPFDAETPISVALKHIQEQAIPPINICPNIPQALNALILKTMEKDADLRYASAKDLISDLDLISGNLKTSPNLSDNTEQYTIVMDAVNDADQTSYINAKNLEAEKTDETDDLDENDNLDENDEFEQPVQNKNLPEKDSKKDQKKSNKKKIIITSVCIALLLVVVAGMAYVVGLGGLAGLKSVETPNVTIPSIVGLNLSDAQAKLKSSGLTYQDGGTTTSDKAAGTVVSCDPNVGTSVKSGSSVKVVLSSGPKTTAVPDLTGVDLTTAKSTITQAGFVVGTITKEYSDSVTSGAVISEDPTAGSSLVAGGTINLVISQGPKIVKVTVPSLANMTLGDAQAKLKDLGISANASYKATGDKTKDNIVYGQDPQEGVSIEKGSSVSLLVTKYDSSLDTSVTNNTNSTTDNKTPDNKTPDNKTPDNKTPDNKTPDNKTPDNKTPDNKNPVNTNQGNKQ